MTLNELCRSLNISRRAVQGYEAHGLVRPSGRTKHGYLLYDPAARERVAQIRRYQQYGFALKEIGPLLEAPPARRKQQLEERMQALLQTRTELDNIITMLANEIKQTED